MPEPLDQPTVPPAEYSPRRSAAFRFAAGFILAVMLAVVMAQTTTLVDFNTQLKNKPNTYTCVSGSLAGQGLANCLAKIPAGGTMVIPSGTWSSIALTVSGITIQCQPGAIIKPTGSFPVLTLAGTGTVVDGCILDGNSVGYPLSINGATNAIVTNSTTRNSISHGIFVTNSTSTKIFRVTSTGNVGDPIFADNDINGIEVAFGTVNDQACYLASQICHGIAVHVDVAGKTAKNISIHDETIQKYSSNFGIEVGCFVAADMVHNSCVSAEFPNDTRLTNNYIISMAAGGGAISCSTASHCHMTGNDFNDQNNPAVLGSYEFVTCDDCSAVDNKAENCPLAGSLGTPPNQSCSLSMNGMLRGKVAHNVIPGFILASASVGPYDLYEAGDYTTIEDNTLILPTPAQTSGYPIGVIRVTCNATTGSNSIQHMKILNNHIIGQVSAITGQDMHAIGLENDTPTFCIMNDILVSGNDAQAVTDGISNITNTSVTGITTRDNSWIGIPQFSATNPPTTYCAYDPGFIFYCTPSMGYVAQSQTAFTGAAQNYTTATLAQVPVADWRNTTLPGNGVMVIPWAQPFGSASQTFSFDATLFITANMTGAFKILPTVASGMTFGSITGVFVTSFNTDLITGGTSGATAYLAAVSGGYYFLRLTTATNFMTGETVTQAGSGATAVLGTAVGTSANTITATATNLSTGVGIELGQTGTPPATFSWNTTLIEMNAAGPTQVQLHIFGNVITAGPAIIGLQMAQATATGTTTLNGPARLFTVQIN